MRNLLLLSLAIFLLFICSSCHFFKRSSDTRVIYIVKENTENVHKAGKVSSEIIGKLHKGDTVVPKNIFLYWVLFDYQGQTGYINTSDMISVRLPDMSKVSNMELPELQTYIRDFLNNYVNWRSWKFWACSGGLLVLSLIFLSIGKPLDEYLDYWNIGSYTDYSSLPYFGGIIGILFSFAYMFWREDVLHALFAEPFWWLPDGKGWIPWYLWGLSVISVIGIAVYWILDLIRFKLRGLLRIFFHSLTAVVTFVTGIFLGIIAIVLLIIFTFLAILSFFTEGEVSEDYKVYSKIYNILLSRGDYEGIHLLNKLRRNNEI